MLLFHKFHYINVQFTAMYIYHKNLIKLTDTTMHIYHKKLIKFTDTTFDRRVNRKTISTLNYSLLKENQICLTTKYFRKLGDITQIFDE